MNGRGTEETERMFRGGVEMVARAGEGGSARESPDSGTVETWRRVRVAPGVELHLRDDLPKLGAVELKELMARLERLLRRDHGMIGLENRVLRQNHEKPHE